MASFFKNLFRKEGDSQPVPAAPLSNENPAAERASIFEMMKEAPSFPVAEGANPFEIPRGASPFSPGGPLSTVTGRHMTARELAALLPPGLLRFDGVSPDQPIPLPLDLLRAGMESGRPSLLLSQIHSACPLLFQRPPMASEDVEVTLPLARVKGMLESPPAGNTGVVPAHRQFSPAGAPTTFQASPGPQAALSESPFAKAGMPFAENAPRSSAPPTAQPAGNPFAAMPPQSIHPVASPFASVASPAGATGVPPLSGNPFSVENAKGSPFAAVSPKTAESAPLSPPAAFSPNPTGTPPPLFTPTPSLGSSPFAAVSPPSVQPSPFAAVAPPSADRNVSAPASPFEAVSPSQFTPAAIPTPPQAAASPFSPVGNLAGLPSLHPLEASGSPPIPPQKSASPFSVVNEAPASPPGAPPENLAPSPFTALPPAHSGSLPPQAPGIPSLSRPTSPTGFPSPSSSNPSSSSTPLVWPPVARPESAAIPASLPVAHPSARQSAPGSSISPPAITAPLPNPALSPPILPPFKSQTSAPVLPPVAAANPSPAYPASGPVNGISTAPLETSGPPDTFPMPAASATDPAPSLDTMDLSLRAVLRDADAGSLGFAPENVPENVRVTLPLELVTQQLATGRVEIGVDDIRLGISEKFRPAFARADEGLRVVVPMSEVFHNLPESAKPALQPVAAPYDHLSITTSPFQTPFAIKAEEDRTKQLLDLSATGFDSPGRSARAATRPVPLPELPPAPLPPVHRMEGGPPAVNVELPPLRPAASASPVAAIAPVNAAAALPNLPSLPLSPATLQELPGSAPMQPRPGMLSRPPVTGAQPGQASLPKLAPRVKAVPASATALKAFPKPQAPPPAAPEFLATAPLPVLPIAGPTALPVEPISPAVEPIAPAAPAIAADSATPATSPTPASFPRSAPSFIHESSDDLGESFSAATLSAEPPPRAGSAPVGPPASFVQSPPSLTPLFRTALTPVAEAPLSPPAIRELPPLSEIVPGKTGADGTPSDGGTPPTPPSTTATEWLTGAVPQLDSSGRFPSQAASVLEAPVRISSPDFVAEAPTLPIADVEFNAPLARPEATPEARPGPTQAASPVEDLSFGYNTDNKQLLLRAVLGTDRNLTEQDIVNLCADLPGLKSCVLFRNESAWISQGTEAMVANTFRAAAERTRDSLADLAETMGLGSGGNFTLRSDLGVRSFFLESGLCLAVWHEQASFVGGTREKLILIAQELAKS